MTISVKTYGAASSIPTTPQEAAHQEQGATETSFDVLVAQAMKARGASISILHAVDRALPAEVAYFGNPPVSSIGHSSENKTHLSSLNLSVAHYRLENPLPEDAAGPVIADDATHLRP